MPSLVRKLLILAAVDGLVLQPLAPKGQRPAPAAKIAYNDEDNNIESVVSHGVDNEGDGDGEGKYFEAFGVVGKWWLDVCGAIVANDVSQVYLMSRIHRS